MKKKQIITLVASVALVGALGVGGTLAYLSSQSNVVKNTFTVGNGYIEGEDKLALKIDEQDVKDSSKRTMKGNDYEDLLPGSVVVKDPTVYITDGSVDSYVFVQVTGIDALEAIKDKDGNTTFDVSNINGCFEKVFGEEGVDGIYVYVANANAEDKYVVKNQKDDVEDTTYVTLGTLFNSVKMNADVTSLPENADINSIVVKACAVQASNNTYDSALKLARETFKK